MTKPLMTLDEVEFDDVEDNGLYTSRRGTIGGRIGARSSATTSPCCRPASRSARSTATAARRRCS